MNSQDSWARHLLALGYAVQRHVARAFATAGDLAKPVAQEGGDTVFEIDRRVEPVIEEQIAAWPGECMPLLLIAEGFGADGRRNFGSSQPRYRLIVDPIDGTRSLMYDKRSAWFIASIANNRGEDTNLGDVFASAMVELPTSKQAECDSFTATTSHATSGYRTRIGGDDARPIRVRPSKASDLKFGFAQVSNFFPGTKVLASDLMEHIAAAAVDSIEPGQAPLFDDQYISTGGQMVELMVGHDRFCCDLRPLFYQVQERDIKQSFRGLECHPYDVAGALVRDKPE